MAHYALIDENNIVQKVITGVDEDVIQYDENGDAVGGSTEAWEEFYASLPWHLGYVCKRTSYHHRIRKQFAGCGFTYDPEKDIFIAPKPFPSWSLNADNDWEAPIQYPEDGKLYRWNEKEGDWLVHEEENTVA
jgi:hypothetical protein